MKTFFLSFADKSPPEGRGFLGACVVDVSADEAHDIEAEMRARFPHAKPGAEWNAAASRKAWERGCNPGGEILYIDITPFTASDVYPRNRLMQRPELEAYDAQIAAAESASVS